MIRYMSHELLTPLNAALVGLAVLSDSSEIMPGSDAHTTISDVTSAITSAVELLESLSYYNKIDCGMLQLGEKESVQIIPFLENCVYSFAPQAEQLGVALSFVTDRVVGE